jgi:hypothetical protein
LPLARFSTHNRSHGQTAKPQKVRPRLGARLRVWLAAVGGCGWPWGSPELLIPGAAAQTRVVSMAGIRRGSWESARAFKGIICDDISEFESYMPTQAVRSPPADIRAWSCRITFGRGKELQPRGRYRRGRAYQTSVPGRRILWPRYQRRRRSLALG